MKKIRTTRKSRRTTKVVRALRVSKAMSYVHDYNEPRPLDAARKQAEAWRRHFVG